MAILVDSSQWIRLLWKAEANELSEKLLLELHTCPPIVQEVIQGFRDSQEGRIARTQFLAFPVVANPVNLDLYLEAADIFAVGRRKGYTVRSSVDCLIAAIALEYKMPVWHADRDFNNIAKFTALEVVNPLA